jgi:hypothetical protein
MFKHNAALKECGVESSGLSVCEQLLLQVSQPPCLFARTLCMRAHIDTHLNEIITFTKLILRLDHTSALPALPHDPYAKNPARGSLSTLENTLYSWESAEALTKKADVLVATLYNHPETYEPCETALEP